MSNKNSYTTEEMKEMVKRISTLTKAEINKFKKSITKELQKSYKIVTKRGLFSDRKFQNGYKNRLGSYITQHHNHVLNY